MKNKTVSRKFNLEVCVSVAEPTSNSLSEMKEWSDKIYNLQNSQFVKDTMNRIKRSKKLLVIFREDENGEVTFTIRPNS